MKWTKVNCKTGEPCGSGFWHDYECGNFKILNNEFWDKTRNRTDWTLTANGKEIGTFKRLKDAKKRAEELESLSEWI